MGSIKSFLFPTYFRRCWCNNGLHCSQMLNEGDTIKFNTKKEPDPTHLPFHAKKMYLHPTAFSIGIPIVKLEEYCNNSTVICFCTAKNMLFVNMRNFTRILQEIRSNKTNCYGTCSRIQNAGLNKIRFMFSDQIFVLKVSKTRKQIVKP